MSHVIARKGVLEGSGLALFLALVHTVNDGLTAILGALLPTLQERLHLGPTLLAVIVAAFWIASSLLQPFFGALAEQVGPRTIGALGVISAALFLSLVGVAPSLWVVFALIILGGMGSAALHPVGTAIAGGSHSHNRTLGVGLFTAGGMVGFALGPLLILALISKYGIEATPWLMIPGLLLGALVYIVLPHYEPHPRQPARRLIGTNLIRGPIGLLAVAGGFTSVAFVTFTSSVPLWLVQEQGYESDAALIGWTLAVFALAAGVGALIGGTIEARIGRQNLLVGSLLLTAVPLLGFLRLEPGSGGFFAAAAAAGMLILISGPVIVVLAQELAPQSPAAAGGTVLGMASAIGGVLYIALGRLQSAIGLESGIAIGFSMVVPAALVTLVVLRRTQSGGS